jgi:hypothetical protein
VATADLPQCAAFIGAVLNGKRHAQLALGAPGKDGSDPADSGAFYFYDGQSAGAPSFSKFWTQEKL